MVGAPAHICRDRISAFPPRDPFHGSWSPRPPRSTGHRQSSPFARGHPRIRRAISRTRARRYQGPDRGRPPRRTVSTRAQVRRSKRRERTHHPRCPRPINRLAEPARKSITPNLAGEFARLRRSGATPYLPTVSEHHRTRIETRYTLRLRPCSTTSSDPRSSI